MSAGVVSIGVFRLLISYSPDQYNMIGAVGGVKVVQAAARLFEHALVPVFFVNTESVRMVTMLAIIGDMILSNHIDKQENVGDAARVKPYWMVVARHISHPVGGCGASLGRELHVAFDLSYILHNSWVRHDIAR